jgi:hypothetical protein
MKLKEIGASVFETTTAGSIAAVASNLFATPIKRTKKKTDRNPSIYDSADPKYKNIQVKGKDPIPSKSKPTSGHQSPHPFRGKLVGEGDMEADREAGIKWVDNPDWKRLHEMDLKMVKDFLDHKEGVSEQPTQSTKQTTQQVTQRAAQLKTVGGGKASAGMVAKGLDTVSQGGVMSPVLVKAIAPYAKAIQKMMSDPKLFGRFKMLMQQANAGSVGRELGEATMQRQHFEVMADIIGSFPGNPKVRMDFMTHAMAKFREINPQFKDSVFVARVRTAMADAKKQDSKQLEKAPPGREKQVKALKKKFKGDKSAPYAIAWAQHNKGKK